MLIISFLKKSKFLPLLKNIFYLILITQSLVEVGVSFNQKKVKITSIEYLTGDVQYEDISDIISIKNNTAWKKLKNKYIGSTTSEIWLRVKIKNSSYTSKNFFFDLGFHYFNRVSFYYSSKEKPSEYQRKDAGKSLSFNKRDLKVPELGFAFTIKPVLIDTVYLKINSSGIIKLPFSVKTLKKKEIETKNHHIILMLFIGILIGVGIFIFLFSIFTNTDYCLYFFIYLIFMILYIFDIEGLSFKYLWPTYPSWGLRSSSISISLAITFFNLFSIQYFELKSKSLSSMALIFSSIIQLFVGVLNLLWLSSESILIHHITGFVSILLTFGFCFYHSIKNKDKIILLAFLSFSLSGILFLIENFGLKSQTWYTKNSLLTGILFQSLFISIGISKKYQKLKRKFYKSQSDAYIFKAIANTTQMLAHDVEKPLDMIRRFSERIKIIDDSSFLVEYNKTQSSRIVKTCINVQNLIDNLLFLSPDLNSVRLSDVFFVDIVKECIYILDSDIKINVNPNIKVQIDTQKVFRILLNLISNAQKAVSTNSGKIWINAIFEKKALFIEVGNTCSSIDISEIKCIFDIFYTSDFKNGRGLGLAIAKKCAEDHQGSIICESNGMTNLGEKKRSCEESNYVLFKVKIPTL